MDFFPPFFARPSFHLSGKARIEPRSVIALRSLFFYWAKGCLKSFFIYVDFRVNVNVIVA